MICFGKIDSRERVREDIFGRWRVLRHDDRNEEKAQ